MNTLDIVLGILLLVGAMSGFKKGFVMEVVSILAFILGIVAGIYLLDWGIRVLSPYIQNLGGAIPFITFLVLFVSTIILVNIVGKIIKSALDLTIFGTFDNMMGAVMGVLKWALGVSVLIWAAGKFNFALPFEWRSGSLLYGYIASVAPTVGSWLMAIFPDIKGLLGPDTIPDQTV